MATKQDSPQHVLHAQLMLAQVVKQGSFKKLTAPVKLDIKEFQAEVWLAQVSHKASSEFEYDLT